MSKKRRERRGKRIKQVWPGHRSAQAQAQARAQAQAKAKAKAPARLPRWRVILSCVLLVCIVVTMIMIFRFSAESKEASGGRSDNLAEMVAPVVVPDYNQKSPAEQAQMVESLKHPIRKLAHFSEFALLGALCAGFVMSARDTHGWKRWIFPALFCLLYAASDEFHQNFTGRGPSVRDVMIDFSGSLTGICLVYGALTLVLWIIARRRNRKQSKKTSESAFSGKT